MQIRYSAVLIVMLLIACGLLSTGAGQASEPTDGDAVLSGPPLVQLAGPPRPLTGRGLENLVAFTRLLGYVRHFHCSEESRTCDWDDFTVRNMSLVEDAVDSVDLARRLGEIFKPLAPTLAVYETAAGKPAVRRLELAPVDTAVYVEAYRHQGCSQVCPGPNIYETSQVSWPYGDQGYIGTALDPDCPFEADLGGGVSCLLPLAVFADSGGTLPHVVPVPRPPDYGLLKYSGNDRASRLAGVALAWNVAQHFYPYFDVVDTDWPAALRAALTGAATDSDEVEYLATLRRMQAAMIDGHARVYHDCSPDGFQVPLVLSWAEGMLVISRTADDAADGLQPGDVVTRINGRAVDAVITDRMPYTAAATPQRLRFVLAQLLSRGCEGEEITYTVEAQDGTTRQATLRCTLPAGSFTDARPEPFCEVSPGIYYLGLARGTENDIEQYLPELEQARGIIVDYRGIPGAGRAFLAHLATEPMFSAQFIVPVYTEPDQRNVTDWHECKRWEIEPAEPHLTVPVIFMIDASTQSYLESLAEFAEAYGLGELVGEATSGSNGNVNPYTIPGGYTMHYTGMIVLKNDGSQHHAVGIQPTAPVDRTIAGIAAGRDEVLDKAIELLNG